MKMRLPRRYALLALAAAAVAGPASAQDGPLRCEVALGLSQTPPLTGLQFRVDYSDVQGSFLGSDAAVSCESLVDGVPITARDQCVGSYADCQWGKDRGLSVSLLAAHSTFAGPAKIVRCEFESAERPVPVDFEVSVEAATTEAYASPVREPTVDVLSVRCRGAESGEQE